MTAVRLLESAAYGVRLYGYLLVVTLLGGAGLVLGGYIAWPEYRALTAGGSPDPATAAAGGTLLVLGLSVLAIGYLGSAYKLVADGVAAGRAVGDEQRAEAGVPSESTETTPSGGQAAAAGDQPRREPTGGADPADTAEPQRAPGIEPESSAEATASGPADAGTTAEEQPADGAAATQAPADGTAAGERTPSDSTVEAGEDPAEADEVGSRRTEGPPEPTPEEIVFGTSGDDEPTAGADSADEQADSFDDSEESFDERTSGSSVEPAARDAPSDPLADPTDDE